MGGPKLMKYGFHVYSYGYIKVLECTMGGPNLMKYFHILMPYNFLMQIESPNNMLHISILPLNLLFNMGM